MTDINQIRRFLYNKQPGKKKALVVEQTAAPQSIKESKVYDLSTNGELDAEHYSVSYISQLMQLFKVNKIGGASPLDSLEVAQAIKAGKTLYAFIDPYADDIDNSRELVVHLKAKDAEKHWENLVGDI